MVNFHILILKLLKAIRVKHKVTLLLSTEQRMGEKSGNVYTMYSISLGMSVESFNRLHPNEAKNPKLHKSRWAERLLFRTANREEMFKYILEEIWKPLESGEMYERSKEAGERIRSRYYPKERKGRGGRTGVLQDASVSEELSGGISGDKQRCSGEAMQGDIGEA